MYAMIRVRDGWAEIHQFTAQLKASMSGDFGCIYLLELATGAYYCGSSIDIGRRLRQHHRRKMNSATAVRKYGAVALQSLLVVPGWNPTELQKLERQTIKDLKRLGLTVYGS